MLNGQNERRGHRAANIAAVLTMLLMLAACASTQVSEQPSSATDFSGTWKLNEDLSEDSIDLASAARTTRGAGRRGSGAGGGRAGGGPAGGGRAGGGRAGGSRSTGGGRRGGAQSLRGMIDEVIPDEDTLVMEQSADKLRMRFGDRGSSYHGFDSTRFVQLAGQQAEQLSGWQKNEFVVETSTDDETTTVTERWTLSQDNAQVTQTVEIKSEQLKAPILLTRVFDLQ